MDIILLIYLSAITYLSGVMADIQCNFEFGKLCEGWSQGVDGAEDDFDWLIWNDHNPSQDAFSVPGYTMDYSLSGNKQERAMFGTPVLQPVGKFVNVSFWFRLNGNDVRHLNVYVRDLSLGSPARKVWSADGSQGEAWHFVDLVFDVMGPFRVLFEATIAGYESDIGVDDIYIKNADRLPDIKNIWGNKIYPDLHASIDVPTPSPISPVNAGTLGGDSDQSSWLVQYLPIILAVIGGSIFWIGIIVIIKCYVRKRRRRKSRERNVNVYRREDTAYTSSSSHSDDEIYTLPVPPDIPAHETITISREDQIYDTRNLRFPKYGFSDYGGELESDFR